MYEDCVLIVGITACVLGFSSCTYKMSVENQKTHRYHMYIKAKENNLNVVEPNLFEKETELEKWINT